ncbi:MAG: Gfo/Idh/MocA family oxidoreductase [Anaerolineae bacterium]|nr:Gfo/Idh/MocA family oxidoreductase [Anaerolineae bacterium]
MKTIRWGIVGCGNVTEVKSGPGFQRATNSSLVAVMRRNGELAKDYAQRHSVPKWYDDAEALIHDPEVDAVYVATPPTWHKQYTLMAAQIGKPIYVEKPMALNHQECQAMMEACRTANVPLFVAYYRRALPRFLKIKDLVDQGAIGEIRFITITLHRQVQPDEVNPETRPWRVIPDIAGGGHFVDLAAHTLDLLDYIFGPIQTVQGFAANQGHHYPAEDIVTATFVFEAGIQGVGSWCFTSFTDLDLNEIVGTQGKISFSSFDDEPVTLTTHQGVTQFSIDHPPHVQQPLIQTVVDELNGMGHCPSTGETAARTTWVMDQILQTYRNTSKE